jgi:hypothetical protein
MGAEEGLRLLFYFCNVSGLLPFRMIFDAQTKRFKQFESHWRHPANWWFLTILIGQFLFFYNFINYAKLVILKENESKSTVFMFIFICGVVNYIVLCLSLRLILFRFRHLETALEIFNKIDRMLTKTCHPSCNVYQRTVIGLILICIGVRN